MLGVPTCAWPELGPELLFMRDRAPWSAAAAAGPGCPPTPSAPAMSAASEAALCCLDSWPSAGVPSPVGTCWRCGASSAGFRASLAALNSPTDPVRSSCARLSSGALAAAGRLSFWPCSGWGSAAASALLSCTGCALALGCAAATQRPSALLHSMPQPRLGMEDCGAAANGEVGSPDAMFSLLSMAWAAC